MGLIILVDALLGSKRASLSACESYRSALSSLRDAFDVKQKDTRFHKGDIMGSIGTAEALGNEAALEPRFWRIPFKAGAFQGAIRGLYAMRYYICTIEYIMAENHKNGGPKNLFLLMLLESSTGNLPKLSALVQDKMTQVLGLIDVFEHEH